MPQLPLIFDAAGLRISFHRCEDRIAHTVGLVLPGRVVPLLASVEGTPTDDWPPSPPLTTVETSQQAGLTRVMLLGMAGRSHWSASLVIREAEPRLEFEVACRLKEPPQRLGSSYRTMVAPAPSAGGVELSVEGETICIAAPVGQPPVCVTPEGVTVPVAPDAGSFPQTVCWSYAIGMASGGR